jgi:hypothetical protein
MIALSGVRLRKLDRLGNVLADFDTPVSDTRPAASKTFWGPYDPAISPDGTRVAYTYYYMTQSQSPGCYPPQCVTSINEGGTGYTRSDRQTAWDEPGFAEHSGWRNPFWVDNATTVLSDPTHLPNADVVVDVPASRGESGFLVKNWFTDDADGNPHVSGGDMSRDHAKAAFVTGTNDSSLTIYRVPTFPTAFPDGDADPSTRPQPCYRYGKPVGGTFGTPTFSPDGSQVAFAVGDGVNVVTVPDLSSGCASTGASPASRLLIGGATQPDWGSADVPAVRPTSPGTPAPPATKHRGGPTRSDSPRLIVRSVRLRAGLAHGVTVTVTGAGSRVRVRLVGRVAKRIVARGSGRTNAAGAASITLRFTRSAARSLRSARRVRIAVSGAGRPVAATLRR